MAQDCAVGDVSRLGNSQTLEFTMNTLKMLHFLAVLLFIRLCINKVEKIPCNCVFFYSFDNLHAVAFSCKYKGIQKLEIIVSTSVLYLLSSIIQSTNTSLIIRN